MSFLFSQQKTRRANGFTLIEMLIVMVIIGILTTLVATNLVTAQSRGRDAKRRADIKALQTAFELYYSENGSYAATCDAMATTAYLPQGVTADPSTSIPYTHQSTCQVDTTDYCICAELERGGGNATEGPSSAQCTYASSGERLWYCQSNVQ